MSLIPIGSYPGKILNYGITKTQGGEPTPAIAFRVTDEHGTNYIVYWRGSFKAGKAKQFAIEALLTCGLRDYRRISDLSLGVASKLLDIEKTYELAIEHEQDQKDPEKLHPRVRWINDAAGGIRGAVEKGEAASLMAGLNLEADFLAIAKDKGVDLSKKPAAAASAAAPTTAAAAQAAPAPNIPF